MNLKTPMLSLLALCCCVAFTFAQETTKTAQCKDGKCPATQCKDGECQDGKCSDCPIAKAMEALPKMTYQVGEESTCCSKSAATLAKKHNKPIHFVVAKKTYDNEQKAFASLVETTESFVNEFVTPCKCDVSGVTKIAGEACNCPVQAGKHTELVKAAVGKVKMTYAVGEKTCSCPMEAAKLAKNTNAKKEFVVAGEKTCCEMTARLNLARAKYKAAVSAMVAAKKKAAGTEAKTQKAG